MLHCCYVMTIMTCYGLVVNLGGCGAYAQQIKQCTLCVYDSRTCSAKDMLQAMHFYLSELFVVCIYGVCIYGIHAVPCCEGAAYMTVCACYLFPFPGGTQVLSALLKQGNCILQV